MAAHVYFTRPHCVVGDYATTLWLTVALSGIPAHRRTVNLACRVREEANWLFKCISEAHNVLSDSRQRRELDAALSLEERYMFYKNDLTTPPGGIYSFQRPAKQKAPANSM